MSGKFEGEHITDENFERIAAQAAMLLTSPSTPSEQQMPVEIIDQASPEPEALPVIHRIHQPFFAMPRQIRLDFEIPWRNRDPKNTLDAQAKRSLSQQKDLMAVAALALSIVFVAIPVKQGLEYAFPQAPQVRQDDRPSRDPGGNAIYPRLEEILQRERQINRRR